MCEIGKQIFKGHEQSSCLRSCLFYRFLLKLHCSDNCFCYFSRIEFWFSHSNSDLTIFTFWRSIKYLGIINWEVLQVAKLGKLRLPQNVWLQLTLFTKRFANHFPAKIERHFIFKEDKFRKTCWGFKNNFDFTK